MDDFPVSENFLLTECGLTANVIYGMKEYIFQQFHRTPF